VIMVGDNFKEKEDVEKCESENLILVDVLSP
jgi:hypothetical protein